MRKIFTLILAFTFIFGGLANAQQLKSIAKAKASVNAVANTNAEIGAFKMNGEKPAEKPATGKQVKLNSLLGSGAKATTVYSEDFTGGMGGWTVVGLGDGSWSVKDESNAGGTAPELMLEWVSGSDFDGQSYCMSPVINTTGYTTLALEFKQWFRNYQGSSVLGVYTTIDDGATWEEVWSETVSANFVEVKNLLITNAHVGNANFRIAFGFNGNTFDIWEWAIDDILLVEPDAHDLAIVAINLNTFVESGSTVTPQVTIRNMGISNEATWSLTLTDGDAYTSTKSDILINIGDNLVVDMDDWTPADGQYTLTATLTLTDDANTSNNTLTATVDVIEFSTAFAWNAHHDGGVGVTGTGPINVVLQSGVMTQIAVDNSDFIAAADYVGLEIYGIRYADGVPCPLVKIDPVTGVVTNIGGGAVDLVGFTYDVTTETAYVIDFNGMLGTINLETGEVTNIGGDYTSVIGLACDTSGNLIAISLADHIASIDKTTGTSTIIGNLGVNINYAQDICYDRDNNILYGALYTDQGAIYIINTTTGAATLVSEVIDELTGFAIPYTLVGPQVVLLTPEADAVDVALDAEVSVTFDVDITAVDLTGITITPDLGNVVPTVNNAVLTIAHDDFAYNTTYTVLVPAGAVSDGVNAITNPITWSFRTELDASACNAPINFVVSEIQEYQATVTWTATIGLGSSWKVVYGEPGFNPDSEGADITVDVATATLSPLAHNTNYEVYVQADCGSSEYSEWVGPISFKTLLDCGLAITNYPYVESFEEVDGSGNPYCWTIKDNDASGDSWKQRTSAGDSEPYEGDYMMTSKWINSTTANDDWLISPQFDITSDNLKVDFYARSASSYSLFESFNVLVSKDGTDISDFTITLDNIVDHSTTWENHKYVLSEYGINQGDKIYVAIQHVSTDRLYLVVDLFRVLEMSNATEVLTYTIPNQVGGTVIDEASKTIEVTMPYGTDATNLVATFTLSEYATAKIGEEVQESGITGNNFTNPVVYTIIAEDGTTQDWTVNVTVELNSEANILTYSLPNQIQSIITDSYAATGSTIDVTMHYGIELTEDLIAEFTLSDGASAKVGTEDQESTVTPNNFASPVVYTVTAEDGTTKEWTVNVTVSPTASSEAEIFSYSIPDQVSSNINSTEGTITVTMPYGTEVTALVADFTLSYGATAKVDTEDQQTSITPNNFTDTIIYKVTAQDGETYKDWNVVVIIAPNTAAEITAYSFEEQHSPAVIDNDNHKVTIEVNAGTNLNGLVATFTLSDGASAEIDGTEQLSGVTPNNFTDSVTYTVTAEAGNTQDWIVIVSVAVGIEDVESSALTIYPNPNNGNFTLDFTNINGKVNYQIFDTKGSIIISDDFVANGNAIKEVSLNLVPGVYFVKLVTETQSLVEKLVVE